MRVRVSLLWAQWTKPAPVPLQGTVLRFVCSVRRAVVNSKDESALKQMADTLTPLSGYKYTLSLDYELSRWDIH